MATRPPTVTLDHCSPMSPNPPSATWLETIEPVFVGEPGVKKVSGLLAVRRGSLESVILAGPLIDAITVLAGRPLPVTSMPGKSMLVGGADVRGGFVSETTRVFTFRRPTSLGGPTFGGLVVGWIRSRSALTSSEPPTLTPRSCSPVSPKPPSANWLSRIVRALTGMACAGDAKGMVDGVTGTSGEPSVFRDTIDRPPPTFSPLA